MDYGKVKVSAAELLEACGGNLDAAIMALHFAASDNVSQVNTVAVEKPAPKKSAWTNKAKTAATKTSKSKKPAEVVEFAEWVKNHGVADGDKDSDVWAVSGNDWAMLVLPAEGLCAVYGIEFSEWEVLSMAPSAAFNAIKGRDTNKSFTNRVFMPDESTANAPEALAAALFPSED